MKSAATINKGHYQEFIKFMENRKMTTVKDLLLRGIKERLEIKNLRATDFAERLRGHVDENKKGLLSDSKSDFFGTVSKNSFKLRRNNIFKTEDFRIYGEFREENGNLTIDIEYSRSLVPTLISTGLLILIIYLGITTISSDNLNLGFILFLTIFLIAFLVANHLSMSSEIERLSKTIKTIFQDSEIREQILY
jgi:hypothetical protein